MTETPSAAFCALDQLLTGETSLAEFEQWVYATPAVEDEIGLAPTTNYSPSTITTRTQSMSCKIMERTYEQHRPGRLLCDRAYRFACGLVAPRTA